MKCKNILLLIMGILFLGCDNYLDVVPENDLTTIETIFEKRNTALLFFNGCYRSYLGDGSLGSDPAVGGSDEYITGPYLRNGSNGEGGTKIAEGLQNPSNPILPTWDKRNNFYVAIDNCNTFINHVDDVYNMTIEEKDLYKANAKAIKALYYFKLLRMYGPIPLIPQNIRIESTIEEMQVKRSPVDSCIKTIVKLFDEALVYMLPFDQQPRYEYGFLTKEAVYGYKAKVLLYAASPLFNGNEWYSNFKNKEGEQLFPIEYDPEKWEIAALACDTAIAYCESRGKRLVSDHHEEGSDLLNTIRNTQFAAIPDAWESTELLYGIEKNSDLTARLPRYSEEDNNYRESILGCLNPTMRMVELFYTENGLPINMDKTWNYVNRYKINMERNEKYKNVVVLGDPVLNLHIKREPRFYANIACDGCYWLRGSYYEEMCPHKGDRHGFDHMVIKADSKINLTGYWCKKGIHPKNYSNKQANNLKLTAPFARLRLADLYLMQAEAWNEVGIEHKEKVFDALNKVRRRAGIPNVEDSWKGYSKQPNKIDTKVGLRDIIRQERNIELAFESQRFWDLRRWKLAHEYMSTNTKGWNVLGEDNETFYNNYLGPVIVSKRNKFKSPRDYFWPIRDEEILKANVVQNPGW